MMQVILNIISVCRNFDVVVVLNFYQYQTLQNLVLGMQFYSNYQTLQNLLLAWSFTLTTGYVGCASRRKTCIAMANKNSDAQVSFGSFIF
jgi:hypothetical protein